MVPPTRRALSPHSFENLDLEIASGTRIAWYGPSGCGKSTLAMLAVRLYRPQTGRILIGGLDLNSAARSSLRTGVGFVSQDSFFLNASIVENFRLVRPNVSISQIRDACRLVLLDDLILRQTDGYETVLGEQGLRLSGGERQRLALARLLLKDTKLVVLDEPTSQLNPDLETQVLANILERLEGQTVVAISHSRAVQDLMDRRENILQYRWSQQL